MSEQQVIQTYSRATQNVVASTNEVAYPLNPKTIEANARQLRGKVVVITGAGSGFGAAYAKKAAANGAKVVISDLNVNAARKVGLEISNAGHQCSVYPASCDVTNWSSQVNFFKHARRSGHIDVVVCNAGVGEVGGKWNDDKLDKNGDPAPPPLITLQVNLIGASYTARLGFYHLRQNPSKTSKAIVLIGSMASFTGIPGGPSYSMAKHGILGLYRSIYCDGLVENIRVNLVAPWFCDTKIIEPHVRLALLGMPLADIEHVVLAMIQSSADPEFSGNAISVDAKGMLCIPFEAFAPGSQGYYVEFAKRATFALSLEAHVRDIVNLFRHLGRVSAASTKGRVIGLGSLLSLYLLIKKVRQPRAP